MHIVITENCMFIPCRKVDDLHTDRYYYKKPKTTIALFCKNRFLIVKIWIYGENIFKRWQVAINTWLTHSHMIVSIISHVQGWMFVAYSQYKRNTTF